MSRIFSHVFRIKKESIFITISNLIQLVKRSIRGEPTQLVLGYQTFYEHEFLINENCLIPRWETESLVDLALAHLSKKKTYKVLDIGSGSGDIGISILMKHPFLKVVALEKSFFAANISLLNGKKHEVDKRYKVVVCDAITYLLTNKLKNILNGKRYDLLLSNPPYIQCEDMKKLVLSVKKFEPKLALYGIGSLGLKFQETVIMKLVCLLQPTKKFLMEADILQIVFFRRNSRIREGRGNIFFDLVKNPRIIEVTVG
ncbi:MAG: HemK family protein methyltransferase [Deltaproteobacteria bacterium]|nr:MAG: HemK family protein methyltransferase [Deltaproteobacteria bacterium]